MSSMISLSKSEKSYIRSGILSNPPSRADGRSLHDFRNIALETGVASLANGSARVSIGRGTEVIAATKLEVVEIGTDDDDNDNDNDDQGRIVCSVSCSPSAYPHLTSPQLEDLQSDLTTLLHTTLSHPTLHPKNLGIIKGRKSWKLHLDVLVLVDSGNILDTIFLASRAALWDTKVPRTRAVEYRAPHTQANSSSSKGKGKQSSNTDSAMDVDGDVDPEEKVEEKDAIQSGFDTRALNRKINRALDFELPDYWDEGEVLDGRGNWPVGITINLVSSRSSFLILNPN
ncbi:hypothetical protein H0H93_002439 [Arthromyces matolae]|nr:hypothetical protein H0H93_002439 [Arthromyces matolae]